MVHIIYHKGHISATCSPLSHASFSNASYFTNVFESSPLIIVDINMRHCLLYGQVLLQYVSLSRLFYDILDSGKCNRKCLTYKALLLYTRVLIRWRVDVTQIRSSPSPIIEQYSYMGISRHLCLISTINYVTFQAHCLLLASIWSGVIFCLSLYRCPSSLLY